MEKAYGYIRVSGLGQVDRDGPVRQREAILGYARANNIDVVRFFVEEGVSGDLIDRPELAEMMVSLENNGNGVKSVIIERLDRLARDVMVQEPIIRDFGNIGVTVMSALEGDVSHSDDPTRTLIRQIFGVIAAYDKNMTVLKLRAARRRIKAKTGKCEGRKGFAETDPEEYAGVVETIALMRSQKIPWAAIASYLNDSGHRSMSGKKYSAPILKMIWRRRRT